MRVRHRLVCERHRTVKELNESDFLKTFLDILHDHYILWTHGVQHRDLSLQVLKYNTADGKIGGILVDFDVVQQPNRLGEGRGRTDPLYMAIESLQAASARESYHIEHLYRHDLETFYWSLIWTCSCIGDDGKEKIGNVFRRFRTGDYQDCFDGKNAYERSKVDKKAALVRPSFRTLWIIARAWMRDFFARVRLGEMDSTLRDPFETDARETWRDFRAIVGSETAKTGLAERGREGEALLRVIDEFLVRTALES